MGRLLKKEWALALLLISGLLSTSGCVGDGGVDENQTFTPTPTPSPTPSPYKDDAKESAKEAKDLLYTLNQRADHLVREVEIADSRGVDISTPSSTLGAASENLKQLEGKVTKINSSLSRGDYLSALSLSEDVISKANSVNRSLTKSKQELEQAYETAIEEAKQELQKSNEEYQIAAAYVSSAKQAGADTTTLQNQLQVAKEGIDNGLDSLQNRQFDTVSNEAKKVIEKSGNIQEKAVTAGKNAEARNEIETIESRLTSAPSKPFIDKAHQSLNIGEYGAVEQSLLQAQQTEQISKYRGFTQTVSNKYNLTLVSLEETLDKASEDLTHDRSPKKELEQASEEVDAALDALDSITSAESEIAKAESESTLFVDADISKPANTLQLAKEKLQTGEYSESIQLSEEAQIEAQDEAKRIQEKIQSNPLLRISSFLYDKFKSATSNKNGAPSSVSISSPAQIDIREVSLSYKPPQNPDIEPLEFEGLSAKVPAAEIKKEEKEEAEASRTPKPPDFDLGINNVDYSLNVFSVSVWGESSITNTGEQTAEDVQVRLELFTLGGERIEINGHNYLEKSVGDLGSGERSTEHVEFTIGYDDANSINSDGEARAKYRVFYGNGKEKKIEDTFPIG